jgi:hypothetical protein
MQAVPDRQGTGPDFFAFRSGCCNSQMQKELRTNRSSRDVPYSPVFAAVKFFRAGSPLRNLPKGQAA